MVQVTILTEKIVFPEEVAEVLLLLWLLIWRSLPWEQIQDEVLDSQLLFVESLDLSQVIEQFLAMESFRWLLPSIRFEFFQKQLKMLSFF
jgi:hypothetical protein